MAALSKPKFKIKRLPEYRSISGGYTHDNGAVAFGDHVYEHRLYNKKKYQEKKKES